MIENGIERFDSTIYNLAGLIEHISPENIIEIIPNRDHYFSRDVTTYSIFYKTEGYKEPKELFGNKKD